MRLDRLMKSRLFLKFLLLLLATSSAVVILMVVTMQFFVYHNFSEYVMQQEVSSLEDFTEVLAVEYRQDDNWEKFRNNPRRWHALVARCFPASVSHYPPPGNGLHEHPLDREAHDAGPRPRYELRPERESDSRRAEKDWRPPPVPPRRPPELSLMARRLSLFDAEKKIVFGNPVQPEQILKKIVLNNQVIGWLGLKKERQMTRPTDISFLKRQSRAFYLIGVIVLMMALIVSIFFSRHLTAPLKKLAQGAEAIRNRRFDERITVTSNDELGQLAYDFNAMAQTLQSFENVRRQWLVDITHELRTPLAVLRGEIEGLQDGIRRINSAAIDSLHAEVMALSTIVNDLSLIAKTESGIIEMKFIATDPVQVLKATIQRFKPRFDDCQITVRTEFKNLDKMLAVGDADKLSQVFSNIFENTLRYAAVPGTLTVGSDRAKDHIRIFVEDSGPGVAKESLSKLFDRLYRTDTARTRETGGSGLGLSICKSIIEAHQGKIWAENAETGGLRIVIQLPRHK